MENILAALSQSSSQMSMGTFLMDIGTALVIGLVLALVYMYKTRYSKSFVVTLAVLPAVVAMVIMLVNGSIGAGVAVAGTFSLVRFRSAPGTAKEIGAIFLAMSAGLACGMGYLMYASIFVGIMSAILVIYNGSKLGEIKETEKTMTITIPETLNYTNAFDDIMKEYTTGSRIRGVKTTNMGSLFKVTYNLTLKDKDMEKEFIDKLRCRNGNLEIVLNNDFAGGEL
ncbi:MAG: DUF4956 domain-containing protein [Peptostreptococcaceae bacterium]|nr:DUF4956 domain-containing protein [Peptostreptococcaceae bacterium]MDY5739534.1 DUF4956 domain-containing protein [Anaerovoracaceae bacterium]